MAKFCKRCGIKLKEILGIVSGGEFAQGRFCNTCTDEMVEKNIKNYDGGK